MLEDLIVFGVDVQIASSIRLCLINTFTGLHFLQQQLLLYFKTACAIQERGPIFDRVDRGVMDTPGNMVTPSF